MKRLQNDIYDAVDQLQTPEHEAAIQLGYIRKLRTSISDISKNNESIDIIKDELDDIANQLEMFVEYTANKQNELRTYANQVGDEDE